MKIDSLIRLLAFSSSFLLLSQNSYSQFNSQKGTMVLSSNDTIQVLIKKDLALRNKNKVTFRKIKGGAAFREASTDEVIVYSTSSDSYVTKKINGNKVFVRIDLVSNVSLYETMDKNDTRNFYLSRDSKELELIERENLRSFLQSYMNDCDKTEIKEMIKKIEYKRFKLTNLLSAYNACIQPEKYVSAVYKPYKKLNLNALVGFEYVTNNYFFGISSNSNEIISSSLAPTLGLSLNLKGERRVHGGMSFSFSRGTYTLDFEDVLSPNQIGTENERDYLIAKLNSSIFLRYRVIQENNIYLKLGGSLSFTQTNIKNVVEFQIEQSRQNLLSGFMVGLDYDIKERLGATLDYRIENGVARNFTFHSNTSSSTLWLGLRYQLN